jgi:hypothetical protein
MFGTATLLGAIGFAAFVLTTGVWFRRARQVAIPANRLAFLGGWSTAAVLGAASFFVADSNWLSGIFGVLALAGGAGLLGLYALGTQGAGNPIAVGDHMPAFHAITDTGARFESTELTGVPMLVKFFRGHW